ncbi:MAG: hypothetical protein E7282_03020 [Lachnospiraceae bacterium]|nr:hypothetical protein [Lachnospiraceae bacterium]
MFEQMKGLTPKKKVEYYIQYYGLVTVIIIAAIAFVGYWIHHLVVHKDPAVSMMVINASSTEETEELQSYLDQLLAECDFDASDYQIDVENGIYIGDEYEASSSNAGRIKVQTVLAAQTVDVMFFDESYSEAMLEFGAFADITDFLPEGYIKSHPDDILYYHDEETDRTFPVAVKISSDSKMMKAAGWYVERDAYVGICYNRLSSEDTIYKTIIKDSLEE